MSTLDKDRQTYRAELENLEATSRQMASVLRDLNEYYEQRPEMWRSPITGAPRPDDPLWNLISRAKTLAFYYSKGERGTVCDMEPVREDERNALRAELALAQKKLADLGEKRGVECRPRTKDRRALKIARYCLISVASGVAIGCWTGQLYVLGAATSASGRNATPDAKMGISTDTRKTRFGMTWES